MTEDLTRIAQFLTNEGFDPGPLDSSMIDSGYIKLPKGWMVIETRGQGLFLVAKRWADKTATTFFTSEKPETAAEKKARTKRRAELSKLAKARHFEKQEVAIESWTYMYARQLLEPSNYLETKGLKIGPGMLCVANTDDAQKLLVVPLYDEHDVLWNLQRVYAGGQKRFIKGARTEGLYHVIHAPQPEGEFWNSRYVYLSEGVAAGLAISQTTKHDVYVSFGKSNLGRVLQVMIKKFGVDRVILAADWDDGKPGNAGMAEAYRLSVKFGVRVVYPGVTPKKSVDFADLISKPADLLAAATDFKTHADLEPYKVEKPVRVKVPKDAKCRRVPPAPEQPPEPIPEKRGSVVHLIQPSNWAGAKPNYASISKSDFPDIAHTENGIRVKGTMDNLEALLRMIGATVRYNVILKNQEWFIPGENATVDNYRNVIYARLLDICARIGMPNANLDHYLTYLAEQNQFNPVVTWVESKPWDKCKRLDQLFETVRLKDLGDKALNEKAEAHKKVCIRKWMLTALAAAYRPDGVKAAGFLVFQGPQYIGKTRWLLSLVPEELNLTVESKTLDPRDKDSVKQTVCFWLVELGELDATFRKSDVAALKGFLSRGSDMFRPAYAKSECHFPRRTVFFGSVNPEQFLVDPTGNRRFWTVAVSGLNADHGLDMQQIWAELLEEYRAGAEYHPSPDEMTIINEANDRHEMVDPIEEKLAEAYDWTRHGIDASATELARQIGYERPTRIDLMHVTSAAAKLSGGKPMRKSNGRKLLWCGVKITPK